MPPGDKMKPEDKKELEDKNAELKKAKESGNLEEMKKKMEEINTIAQKIGAAMYQQPGANAQGAAGAERLGIGRGKPQGLDKALALGGGQFGQRGTKAIDKAWLQLDRQQIGTGEVAVVVGVFFGAHAAGFFAVAVVEAGFLNYFAAAFNERDLPLNFQLNGFFHKFKRVEVFGFGALAKFGSFTDADVHIKPHVAVVQVGV
jgi:hypothetical protein